MRHPVSFAASRTFCPPLPIANESWSSATSTFAWCSASSICMSNTFAGANALATYIAGSSDHSITSIFSPLISLVTVVTRTPRPPTHAPVGSTCGSFDATAILVLLPASRAIDFISTTPVAISGASISNKALTNCGCERDSRRLTPRMPSSTENRYALILSPRSKRSPGICSSRGIIPLARLKSTYTIPFSNFSTCP